MQVEGKAIRKECLSDFAQSVKLTATNAEEARFLAILFRAVGIGGCVAVTEKGGRTASFTYEKKEEPCNSVAQG